MKFDCSMITKKESGFMSLRVMLPVCLVLFLSGCGGGDQPNVELVQGMMEDPGYKTQERDSNSPTGSSMRLPPEGTVPRGFQPYAFKGDPEGASQELKNPRVNDRSPGWIARGQKRYEVYCGLCHGQLGRGDGAVGLKMPLQPPSLVGDRARGLSDGLIYHIISDGQGVMGSYANQVAPEDRWAVVSYIRNLQTLTKGR